MLLCNGNVIDSRLTSSSQQKCLKSRTEKLEVFIAPCALHVLRAEDGLDERLAVGIGITLREVEAGEDERACGDERAGDEGRNVSRGNKRYGVGVFSNCLLNNRNIPNLLSGMDNKVLSKFRTFTFRGNATVTAVQADSGR